MLKLYRFIIYLLLAVAGILVMLTFGMLPLALANPAALLPVFLIVCIIIYTYASWRFLLKGIDGKQPCKPVLRDLIRVNGVFSAGIAIYFLVSAVFALLQKEIMKQQVELMMGSIPAGVDYTKEQLLKALRTVLIVIAGYGTLLALHVVLSFVLLKKHRSVFAMKEE